MYLPKDASRARIREAQKARENRAEIVRALSHGEISRRELFKWGLFTSSGLLAWKHGLNVYAPSAYHPAVPPPQPADADAAYQRRRRGRLSNAGGRAQRQAGLLPSGF
jgi:hypothetical protein